MSRLRGSGDREKAILDYKRFSSAEKGWIDSSSIAEDFIAFANSGGGRMLFGAIEENECVRRTIVIARIGAS